MKIEEIAKIAAAVVAVIDSVKGDDEPEPETCTPRICLEPGCSRVATYSGSHSGDPHPEYYEAGQSTSRTHPEPEPKPETPKKRRTPEEKNANRKAREAAKRNPRKKASRKAPR
jgi:hypothetical protein